MNGYRDFMARQTLSEVCHRRILDLPKTRQTTAPKGSGWKRWAGLAACLAVTLGVGAFALSRRAQPIVPDVPPTTETPAAIQLDDQGQGDRSAFLAQGPGSEAKLMFPNIFAVTYHPDPREMAAEIMLPDGAFSDPLSKEEILTIFWGPEGKPEVENPKADTGDFPLFLMNWADYLISGQATYDGEGELWMLTISGEKGDSSFTLKVCPGQIPPDCCVEPDLETTDVLGTAVTGWRRSYDRDGDGLTDHIVGSKLLVGGYGMEFENVNSGGLRASEADGGEATDLGGAMEFNAMFVNHVCRADGALYLDHLLHTDDVPDWWDETFDTLAQARDCQDFLLAHPGHPGFAAYLPTEGPEGYGEFAGHLRYQEERENLLSVRWSVVGGYDDVTISVRLPEGDSTAYYTDALVDAAVPESYDWRLYDGAICDVVPEEYQQDFYQPTFRAEDMTQDIVAARAKEHDTGGEHYVFSVLHSNGAVVSYDCSGVSAQYVWSLVEATL